MIVPAGEGFRNDTAKPVWRVEFCLVGRETVPGLDLTAQENFGVMSDPDEALDDVVADANDQGEEESSAVQEVNADAPSTPQKRRKVHRLSLDATNDFTAELARRGVIYLAHVPPHLNPAKLKHLMSQHGTVTRVYLQPSDRKSKNRRNNHKRYTEGWIEFSDKKRAKYVAQALHQTSITAQKGKPLAGDLWSLKYLRKFKWDYLTEKVAYERRVREQKLRLETMQAKREANYYKQQLEASQKLDYIESRRKEPLEKKHKKERTRDRQLRPLDEGAGKPSEKALLDALL